MSKHVWHVGQKVICIDDAYTRAVMDWCDFLPVAGGVYTIRAMQVRRDRTVGGTSMGFLLEEFVNPPSSLGFEAGFTHTRFKPLVETNSETVRNALAELAGASAV